LGELDGVVWSDPFFSRIDLSFDCDAVFRKKLLRLPAGDSPRTVVVPIDRLRHDSSSQELSAISFQLLAKHSNED
jgi:hypothetical protein